MLQLMSIAFLAVFRMLDVPLPMAPAAGGFHPAVEGNAASYAPPPQPQPLAHAGAPLSMPSADAPPPASPLSLVALAALIARVHGA